MFRRLLLLAFLVLAGTGCFDIGPLDLGGGPDGDGGGCCGPPPALTLADMFFARAVDTLAPGEVDTTRLFLVSNYYGYGYQTHVVLASSDTSLATLRVVDTIAPLRVEIRTRRSGVVLLTATAENHTASMTLTVSGPIVEFFVAPDTIATVRGAHVQFSARGRDAQGLTPRMHAQWSTSSTGITQLSQTGQAEAIGLGNAIVTAQALGLSATAVLSVATLSFAAVSAGSDATCALTTAGRAYCWGQNTATLRATGGDSAATMPVGITGGLTFTQVSVGSFHACAITTAGAAYCWGMNANGELGSVTSEKCSVAAGVGGPDCSTTPLAVPGGLVFTTIRAAWSSCGLTADSTAYCWGAGNPVPRAVRGHRFSDLSLGDTFACGVEVDSTAYCWPLDGQPVRVDTAHFIAISGGYRHWCSLAADRAARCWGDNAGGQLGDGSTNSRTNAMPVLGGLSFLTISAGVHTCGVTSEGAGYCWGYSGYGQLGIGTNVSSSGYVATPAAITGGLTLASVSSGARHSCAVTTSGALYCWGAGSLGALGAGNRTDAWAPQRVAGQD
ncbi:MAG TPA: hypothetical protein VN803_01045 [Gemmatimonadales bacterium]|nr:hypothetical protein [Gemmatimonadales bacterium]